MKRLESSMQPLDVPFVIGFHEDASKETHLARAAGLPFPRGPVRSDRAVLTGAPAADLRPPLRRLPPGETVAPWRTVPCTLPPPP